MEVTPDFIENLWLKIKPLVPSKDRQECCYLIIKMFYDHHLLDYIEPETLYGIDVYIDNAVKDLIKNIEERDYESDFDDYF